MSQSNTQAGIKPFIAGEDLSAMNDRLVEIRNNSGVPNAYLPDALTDHTPFVVTDGATAGLAASLAPFTPARNFRIVLKGTCVAGDIGSLADPATAADKGKIRKMPTASGKRLNVTS